MSVFAWYRHARSFGKPRRVAWAYARERAFIATEQRPEGADHA